MMKLRLGKSACVVAAAAIFGLSGAQVTKQGNNYLFRMRFTKGSKVTYIVDSDTSMQTQKIKVNLSMTQTVTAVKNGIADLKIGMGAMTMTMNGKAMNNPMAAQMPKAIEMKVDSMGRPQGGGGAGDQLMVALPKEAIPVGKSWTATQVSPAMGQSMTVQATYTFVGVERSGRYNAAKLKVSLKSTGQMAMTGSGYSWIDMSDGSLLKSSMNTTMKFGANTIPVKATVTRK